MIAAIISQACASATCFFKGHKRGKRIAAAATSTVPLNHYRCPRCKATWTRKVKVA